jgi:putative oxidoreductase
MNDASSSLSRSAAPSLTTALESWAPYVLSIMRIIVALLFLEHGSSKLFGFPQAMQAPAAFSIAWFSGVIEFVGGALVALGLLTRLAAFIVSGEMAVGYFMVHAPQNFFPIINHGDGAILYCFIFLYLVFAGAGPWSLDALIWGRGRA